jgi:hypothetical protein
MSRSQIRKKVSSHPKPAPEDSPPPRLPFEVRGKRLLLEKVTYLLSLIDDDLWTEFRSEIYDLSWQLKQVNKKFANASVKKFDALEENGPRGAVYA